jgi:hypothetical protein
MQTNGPGEWRSLAEAADLLGCSIDTVRRRLKRGDLESRKLHTRTGYRWEIRLGSPPGHAQVGKKAAAQATAQVDTTALVEDQTRRQLEVLRDTLVLPLIDQNRALHDEVGSVREALGRERERREQLERERDELQARLEALEASETHETRSPASQGAGYVYREPEPAKKPWWKLW